MKDTAVYIWFEGQAREAMGFYATVFGGEATFTRYGDCPPGAIPGSELAPELVMHAELTLPGMHLMAADMLPGDMYGTGGSFSISVECDDAEELERVFYGLLEDGEMVAALKPAFWGGTIGRVTDRFGISWMVSVR